MGILLKQSSPVEVEIEVKFQDVIVFQRHLTKNILSKPNRGAMSAFVNQFQENKDGENNILHWARILNLGSQVCVRICFSSHYGLIVCLFRCLSSPQSLDYPCFTPPPWSPLRWCQQMSRYNNTLSDIIILYPV